MNFLINVGPGIGDIIQKIPMARAIKSHYPDSNIDFIMKSNPSGWKLDNQIIDCQHYVRNLYWYNINDKLQCIKVLFQLWLNHYDYGFVRDGGMINVGNKPSFWIFRIMRWARCKHLVGYIKDYVDIYVDIPPRSHFLTCDELTVKAIGVTEQLNANVIDTSKIDFSFFDSFDTLKHSNNIIALSVGTNAYPWKENDHTIIYDVKSWPYQRWIELASELSTMGYNVILMGGKQELQAFIDNNIIVPDNPHIFNFIGKTSLKQSFAVLSKCMLVVGAEGGMMHCAAALGINTLTIFGGTDYKLLTPANGHIISLNLPCSPCHSTPAAPHCQHHKCLDNITVDMVLHKIISIINHH